MIGDQIRDRDRDQHQTNVSFLIFVSIVIGSILFMIKTEYGEFLVIGFVILFALTMNYKIRKPTDDKFPIDIMCGWFWLGWITYGYLFRDITVSFELSNILSILIIFMVAISYMRIVKENEFVMDVILFATLLLLLMPTEDNVFIKMNPAFYSIKIGFFVFLYVFGDADIDDMECQKTKNVKIIRSTWVLYSSRVFLIGVAVQILFLFYSFRKALLFDNVEYGFKRNIGNNCGSDDKEEEDDDDNEKIHIGLSNIIIEDGPVPIVNNVFAPASSSTIQSSSQSLPVEMKKITQEEKETGKSASVIILNSSANVLESESYSQTATSIQSSGQRHGHGHRKQPTKTKTEQNIQTEKDAEQLLRRVVPNLINYRDDNNKTN